MSKDTLCVGDVIEYFHDNDRYVAIYIGGNRIFDIMFESEILKLENKCSITDYLSAHQRKTLTHKFHHESTLYDELNKHDIITGKFKQIGKTIVLKVQNEIKLNHGDLLI